MKRFALLILALLVIGCFVAPQASAQLVYLGMYWVEGEVEIEAGAPPEIGTAGRWVVVFKDPLVNNEIQDGYADDFVVGAAGREDEFMVNAYEDFPAMPVTPGETYYAAIVNDPDDNYGADPVAFTMSGNGFDRLLQNLVLAFGAGPRPPSPRGVPQFADFYFGKRVYQARLVEEQGLEFIVSPSPRISSTVSSAIGINASKVAMKANEGTDTAFSYSLAQASKVTAAGPRTAPTQIDFVFDMFDRGDRLPDGENEIKFTAENALGTAVRVCTVTVAGGKPRVIGIPITWPSPLHLMTTNQVTFQYTLSHDLDVDIYLFDVTGRVIKKFILHARGEGGSAGINKVTWNLVTEQGQKVASGIYVFTFVDRQTGKSLGPRGKFTALP
jgi:hypothetical protein